MPYPVESFSRRYPRVIPYTLSLVMGIFIVGGLFWIVAIQQAKARDAKRLADMQYIASLFLTMKLQSNSFRSASGVNGCKDANVVVNRCDFESVGVPQLTLRGPRGDYYVVTTVPGDATYEIQFELERSYSGLAAGVHRLTPEGID